MKSKTSTARFVLLTSASFAGYNIGSGFATGVEALQFFASWGAWHALLGLIIAFVATILVFCAVYVTGFEQKFVGSKEVYRYFCGKRLGVFFDYYIYISMILITLTMMSGAGATIQQYCGLPTILGSAIMGVLCIATSLLNLEKLRSILSYMCILIVLFILTCGIYATVTSSVGPVEGSAGVEQYAASGEILRSNTLGLKNPYLSGLTSGGLVISSGFAWASATGTLCKTRKQAVLSGLFSSLFFYAATAVVVYLVLIAMPEVAGKEVPMLAIVQHFLPILSPVYSGIIIVAIYSTISGRLFLIGERYGRGNRLLTLGIVTGITILAVVGASFIPFSKMSNLMFSFCGAVGILFGLIVLVVFCKNKLGPTVKSHFRADPLPTPPNE